jgi:hypothetical protein
MPTTAAIDLGAFSHNASSVIAIDQVDAPDIAIAVE